MSGWIGVDLDATLAEYKGWVSSTHIGEPVPAMLERVKGWLANGREVRIFTARVWPYALVPVAGDVQLISNNGCDSNRLHDSMLAAMAIRRWCEKHLGQPLAVTCAKDYGMVEVWDDRAVQVIPNSGEAVTYLQAVGLPVKEMQ